MFHFENISLKNIVIFSDVLNNLSVLKKEFIGDIFLKTATNYEETINFLKDLNLIAMDKDYILPKQQYATFLNSFKKSSSRNDVTRDFLLNRIFSYKCSFTEYLNEYFSLFNRAGKYYTFTPSTKLRLKYKGLRNFLMELGFVYLDSDNKKYVISDQYSTLCDKFMRSQLLSLSNFLKIRANKEKIGKEAELQIINYEQKRLFNFPKLSEKIEHTAIKDVQAGFDIKSFNIRESKNGNPTSRYIEVKAVSPWDYSFYLTRNEVEKSRIYKSNYYLYLLPVIGKEKFDITALKIIKDPYLKVYKNKKEWVKIEELFSFSLNKGLKK